MELTVTDAPVASVTVAGSFDAGAVSGHEGDVVVVTAIDDVAADAAVAAGALVGVAAPGSSVSPHAETNNTNGMARRMIRQVRDDRTIRRPLTPSRSSRVSIGLLSGALRGSRARTTHAKM